MPDTVSNPQKLGHLVNGDWCAFSHPPVFTFAPVAGWNSRLVAGVPGGDPLPFIRLVETLTPPYLLLYVLHTPRGEGAAGRYQSPPLTAEQFRSLMDRFGAYLSADARFDLWAHSPDDAATVVWDRHNLIFGYGPLERYAAALRELGFEEETPAIPAPHVHHYRSEFDAMAGELLACTEWSCSPLQPEDEQ